MSRPGIGFPHESPTAPSHVTARTLAGVSTFHLREIRPGWVPPLLRGGGAHATGQHPPVATCRFPAASPQPRSCLPSSGASRDEAFRDSLAFTRPAFPSPVAPGWNRKPLGSTSGFGPRRYQRRPPRRGRATEHRPGTTPSTTRRSSNLRVHSQQATSCRTRWPRPAEEPQRGQRPPNARGTPQAARALKTNR